MSKYLEGESVVPATAKQARSLKGEFVCYLRSDDIDRSGRGYIFPRYGVVEGAIGRNIIINGDYICLSRLEEMVLWEADE